jgi:N-acetylmuramoyl-L-alanine amidase
MKTALSALALVSILGLASCGTGSQSSNSSSSYGRDYWGHRPGPKGFRTVILDAGHGGKDSGAISAHNGVQEKDIALDMVRRIKSELSGYRVIMMRSDDQFIDLDERVRLANKHGDAVLLSLHFNSGPSYIRGPETYYWRVDSHGLATRLQQAMEQVSPVEQNNREKVRRRLRLTRNPEIPSVLLECGYLSNASEAQLAADPSYRARMAEAIAEAIKLQSANGDAGTGALPPEIKTPPSRPTDSPTS